MGKSSLITTTEKMGPTFFLGFFLVYQIQGALNPRTCEKTDPTPGPKQGLYKNTWAASDPIECYNWMTNFLPVLPEPSDCPEGHFCECAIQGRVHTLANKNVHGNFGLHTVNCTHHPVGPWSLRQIEDVFGEKIANFTNGYHPFMDYNMGFWTNNLDPYIASFNLANVKMGAMRWTFEGKTYYSLLLRVCGMVLLELMSDKQTKLTELGITINPAHPRMHFHDWNDDLEENELLTPVKVSRAISRPGLTDKFYIEILGSRVVKNVTYSDGVSVLEIVPPLSKIHMQFWYRPDADDTGSNVDIWNVKNLEKYINYIHNEVVVNNICGMDVWMDHHTALDGMNGQLLNEVADKLDAGGYKYRWWKVEKGMSKLSISPFSSSKAEPRVLYQIYAADETGWGMQLKWPSSTHPPNTPSYSPAPACATYATDGVSTDCRGQGYCPEEFYNRVYGKYGFSKQNYYKYLMLDVHSKNKK